MHLWPLRRSYPELWGLNLQLIQIIFAGKLSSENGKWIDIPLSNTLDQSSGPTRHVTRCYHVTITRGNIFRFRKNKGWNAIEFVETLILWTTTFYCDVIHLVMVLKTLCLSFFKTANRKTLGLPVKLKCWKCYSRFVNISVIGNKYRWLRYFLYTSSILWIKLYSENYIIEVGGLGLKLAFIPMFSCIDVERG